MTHISLAKWSYCAVTVHVLETQAQRLCLMQELGQKERPWDRGSPMLRAGPARCLLPDTEAWRPQLPSGSLNSSPPDTNKCLQSAFHAWLPDFWYSPGPSTSPVVMCLSKSGQTTPLSPKPTEAWLRFIATMLGCQEKVESTFIHCNKAMSTLTRSR